MFRTLKLTDDQLSVISEALMLGQYGRVAPVVSAINEQLKAQSTAQIKEGDDVPPSPSVLQVRSDV